MHTVVFLFPPVSLPFLFRIRIVCLFVEPYVCFSSYRLVCASSTLCWLLFSLLISIFYVKFSFLVFFSFIYFFPFLSFFCLSSHPPVFLPFHSSAFPSFFLVFRLFHSLNHPNSLSFPFSFPSSNFLLSLLPSSLPSLLPFIFFPSPLHSPLSTLFSLLPSSLSLTLP